MTEEESNHYFEVAKEIIDKYFEEKKLLKECRQTGRTTATTEKVLKTVFSQMTEDIQQPNGDFIKQYPDVTRVEVIGNDGREFVHYGCSNVKVSLQDDGRTIKVFLYTMFQQKEPKPMDDVIDRLENKYKKAEENAASYMTDEVIDRVVKKWEENPPEFLKFELGKTLEELICKCMVDYNSIISVGLLEDILNNIEKWMPDFQSHEGTQSSSVIDLVDGYNDALKKIKSKLRNKK